MILRQITSRPAAIICSGIILVFIFLSLFAYVFIPDPTPHANRQIPQIALRKPGYKQKILRIPRNIQIEERSWLQKMASGHPDKHAYIPVDSIDIKDGLLIAYFGSSATPYEWLEAGKSDKRKEQFLDNRTFILGTDKFGRDNLSRLILGLRVSLLIGFLAVTISIIIGTIIGSVGGYYGTWIDKLIMLVINTAWSIPTLLLAFAIILAFGKGMVVIFMAVGLTMWVDVARIVRGQVLQIKQSLFVKAAKVMGIRDSQTILYHILPNIIGPLLVIAAANFATAILVEAGLSYLGLGVQPPTPSLGNMLKENYAYATGGFVYLALFPILTIMSLVLSFNLLGTALRDIFDVKSTRV